MSEFAVTFQQKYNREEMVHSVIPDVTGDSFLVIEAKDIDHAHVVAFDLLGRDWAFVYRLNDVFRKDIEQYGLKEVRLA